MRATSSRHRNSRSLLQAAIAIASDWAASRQATSPAENQYGLIPLADGITLFGFLLSSRSFLQRSARFLAALGFSALLHRADQCIDPASPGRAAPRRRARTANLYSFIGILGASGVLPVKHYLRSARPESSSGPRF